jgi:hypothetical protein
VPKPAAGRHAHVFLVQYQRHDGGTSQFGAQFCPSFSCVGRHQYLSLDGANVQGADLGTMSNHNSDVQSNEILAHEFPTVSLIYGSKDPLVS